MSRKKVISKDDLDRLRSTPTASICDALDRLGLRGFMNYDIKPIIDGKRIVGPAVTVLHRISTMKEAPTKALEAIDSANPGDIIVVTCDGDAHNVAFYGGLMATASKVKGIGGAVLDGGVRDVVEVRDLGFQIFARSRVPTTSVGRSVVSSVNVTVECGGVQVHPGDIIVADDDGVVVIPISKLLDVLKISKEIDDLERQETAELRKGAPLAATVKKYARV